MARKATNFLTESGGKIFRSVSRPALSWALAAVVVAVFVYQFFHTARSLDWGAFAAALARPGRWRWLVVALVLMPVNWLLEARKWHLLLVPFLPWGYPKALRATLAGVSLSAATPNRVGEVAGRLLLARRAEWPGVVASTLLGSLSQWVAFLVLGWPALVWTLGLSPWLSPAGLLPLLAVGLGGRPLLRWVLNGLRRRFGWEPEELRRALRGVKLTLILRAGGYACLRFGVYCTQLYALLWFFGLELPRLRGLAGIAAIYLVQAGVPLPPGVNLLARAELGALLWGTDAASDVAVLAAFTALFAINVLLPAVPGYWLIVRKNQ